jgi:hypothetical protein
VNGTGGTGATGTGGSGAGGSAGGGAGGSGGGGAGGSGGGAATGGDGGSGSSSPAATTGGGCEVEDCCLDDPDKTSPGQCGCDVADTDSDGDGSADCVDQCPDDADKSEPGECGCGIPDEDTLESAGCVALKNGIVHRYSFNGEGAAADSQGDANGEIVGTTLTGDGSVVLSPESGEQYVTLPAGIVSSLTSASLEAWFTWDGGPMWTRLIDFGSTVEGVPGESGTGQTFILFTPSGGAVPGHPYATFNAGDAATEVSCTTNTTLSTGVMHHVVLSLDTGQDTLALYIDGALACAKSLIFELPEIDDVNCWLGRSQYTSDTGFAGSVEEFRIYDLALTADQVLLSFDSGPEPAFL